MQLRLIAPTITLQKEYLDMLQDWRNNREMPVPWIVNCDNNNFPAMIKRLEDYSKGIGLVGDQVAHSTYWMVGDENRIIGVVDIRHRLNESLLKTGGNIGYGIRPSERRKGYGSAMLKLALGVAKDMEMEKVLITCDDWNIASERTILKNGGIFETNELEHENVVRRYWIYL